MAIYSLTLAVCAGCFGFTLGRWLGERAGRNEAMVEEAFWKAIEHQRKAEARQVMIWDPSLGGGAN